MHQYVENLALTVHSTPQLHLRATRFHKDFVQVPDLERGIAALADRAYDSNVLREWLAERGAWGNIRAMPHRVDPPAFSSRLYRQRNAAGRFFNKLKHFRAVATRYDKRDDNYLASVKLASVRIWLRYNESVTQADSADPAASSRLSVVVGCVKL